MIILFTTSKEGLTYKVNVETVSPSNNKTSFSYLCEIKKMRDAISGYIVGVKRSRILLNNTLDNTPIEEVLLKLGEVVSDLKLRVSYYGEILRIKNFKQIQKEWEANKFRITKTYFGDSVAKLVEGTQRNLVDEAAFIKSLSKDPFLNVYLNGIYAQFEGLDYQVSNQIHGLDLTTKIRNQVKIDASLNIEIAGETKVSSKDYEDVSKVLGKKNFELIQNRKYALSRDQTINMIQLRQESFVAEEGLKILRLYAKLLKS